MKFWNFLEFSRPIPGSTDGQINNVNTWTVHDGPFENVILKWSNGKCHFVVTILPKRVDKVLQEVIIDHEITTGASKIDQIYPSPTCWAHLSSPQIPNLPIKGTFGTRGFVHRCECRTSSLRVERSSHTLSGIIRQKLNHKSNKTNSCFPCGKFSRI